MQNDYDKDKTKKSANAVDETNSVGDTWEAQLRSGYADESVGNGGIAVDSAAALDNGKDNVTKE